MLCCFAPSVPDPFTVTGRLQLEAHTQRRAALGDTHTHMGASWLLLRTAYSMSFFLLLLLQSIRIQPCAADGQLNLLWRGWLVTATGDIIQHVSLPATAAAQHSPTIICCRRAATLRVLGLAGCC